MYTIVLIVHDIRSCHNVGSILRTADGFGVNCVYLTGYTPYPVMTNDTRLPHIARKMQAQISKTALGAEQSVPWQHESDLSKVLGDLRKQEYELVALEQAPESVNLPDYVPPKRVALLLGREVEGVAAEYLSEMDAIVEIPMFGTKESFNVAQAAAIALYQLRTTGKG